MARGKRHTAEQIVNLLRQVEVGVAKWEPLRASHFSTPPTATRHSCSVSNAIVTTHTLSGFKRISLGRGVI